MLFSSVFDYCNGRLLNKFKEDWKRKAVLILSVIVNIGLLFFFKYYNFVIDNLNYIFKLNISASNLSLPLGISFYTFQTLSYTIDVYRGEVEASNSFFDYSAYVAMFPQLVAGPIVRYIDIYNQLKNRDFSDSSIAYGIKRFVYGLAKKVLIANKLGELYKIILAKEVAGLASSMAWLGIIAFTLQIYFDFSGYSDMAIGLGRMLGFDFLENFNFPYISKSITEFWRRWHMSLSLWFRNYVYI
ncbi:MAG: MBOAT family O-acyltransferase, partial [Fenollaria timonensis]